MSQPVSSSDFRRVSPHVVKVQPRRISQFKSTREMVVILRDLVLTHKLYFEAGFIHRNISEENTWIMEGESEGEGGQMLVAGALLELDSCHWCRRYTRGADDDAMEVLDVD